MLLSSVFHAQTLTVEEAKAYARQLGAKEILSEKGVERLKTAIDEKTLRRIKQPVFEEPQYGSARNTTTDLSKAQLIFFLANVFAYEAYHRSGFMEVQNMVAEVLAEYKEQIPDEAAHKKINKELRQKEKELETRYNQLPGVRLERAIQERLGIDEPLSFTNSNVIGVGSWSGRNNRNVLNLEGFGYVHNDCSALGLTLEQTLEVLKEIGLLPELDFAEFRNGRPLEYNESSYLRFATEEMARQEDRTSITDAQLEIADRLLATKAVSPEQHLVLRSSIEAEPLGAMYDYLPYLTDALVVDLNTYEEDSREVITSVFKKLGQRIPSLKAVNVRVDSKIETAWNTSELFTVTLSTKQEEYRSVSFFITEAKTSELAAERPAWFLLRPASSITDGINQWLVDAGKDERLFFQELGGYGSDTRRFALVLLNEDQLKAFGPKRKQHLFERSPGVEKFYSTSTKKELNEYFQSLGLLDHLPESELTAVENCWRSRLMTKEWDMLECYPRISVIIDDWESGNIDNPYEELTEQFAKASRGYFSPTEIKDEFRANWEEKTTDYGFTLRDQTYTLELPMMRDWLDPRFIDLINEALLEQKAGGKFYVYRGVGNIFLTTAQYEALSKRIPELFKHGFE